MTCQNRCRYKLGGYSSNSASLRCSVCDNREERDLTDVGHKVASRSLQEMIDDNAVHETWWAFQKKFMPNRKRGWRWSGYDLMKRVADWAEGRADVHIVACDDDWFCSSSLVVIEHSAPRKWMGLTVVYIPQCTGEQPISFFLYPNHATTLVKLLKTLNARASARAPSCNESMRRSAGARSRRRCCPTSSQCVRGAPTGDVVGDNQKQLDEVVKSMVDVGVDATAAYRAVHDVMVRKNLERITQLRGMYDEIDAADAEIAALTERREELSSSVYQLERQIELYASTFHGVVEARIMCLMEVATATETGAPVDADDMGTRRYGRGGIKAGNAESVRQQGWLIRRGILRRRAANKWRLEVARWPTVEELLLDLDVE